MYSPGDFLFISSSLASLTYFIGTLIMGLPLPVYGVKKWGTKLILDGIYATVLINIYALIIYASQYIGSILGASWPNFFSWLYQILQVQITVSTLVKTAYVAASFSDDPGLSILMAPLMSLFSLLSGLIAVVETIIILSYVVYDYSGVFIAIGILFISLPFRIGRAIGGALIGFSIVFYIGLPYLATFLSQLGVNILINGVPSNTNAGGLVNSMATQVVPIYVEGILVMPSAYLVILSGLALGLGSAISGSSARLPFPIEIF
ncbi:DNA import protein CedA [Acidianus sp. RZ1]|uniref:DNA import protein CedA n=1 Tax=Acidianus sp. RZ1 TaxID=1540082 RepID=UPI001490FCE9|nr:hypothetical protein [Acidianus sp. RZ1]